VGTHEPPRLRGVLKSDIGAIAELEATAFGTNSLTRSALDVIYDPSGGFWLLAEDFEGVWGHSVNSRGEDPHVGWILGMAIHPERQKRGWGTVLLQATIDRLYDSDMNVIRLLVKSSNKVARRLYENFGFIDTGERSDHLGPGEDRMVMSLLLDQRRVPAAHPAGLGALRLAEPPARLDGTPGGHVNGVAVPQIPVDPDFV
jgi:ribosomal protein S18 acetylase RimI-like enzyme